MNNTFKKFLEEKNALWMLLSLAIAFALWVIVINTQNPEDTKTYQIKMEIANYEMVEMAGYVITNLEEIENEVIKVPVRGPRLSLDRLSNSPDIDIIVDMSKVDFSKLPGTVPISLDYYLPQTIDSIQIDNKPKTEVMVKFERLVTEPFKVQVVTGGQAKDGYVMMAEAVSPSDVVVSGASSSVEKVKGVRVDVDITGMEGDQTVLAKPYAYDETGAMVEDVSLNMAEIEVELKAHVFMTLPIEYSVSGPGEGYVVDDVICTPFELVVTGKPDVLDAIDSVVLPEINVFGRTSSVQQIFYLDELLPEGIKAANGIDKIIVDVKVIASARVFIDANTEDVEMIGKEEGLSYTVRAEDYKLLLEGSGEKIFALEKDDYSVTADVSGLGEGEHVLEAEVTLPENIVLVGEKPTVAVTITGQ